MLFRSPDASLADKTWDDYIEDGAIAAIRAVQDITGADTFDMLGFCVGGTILSTALAVLAARGEQAASSLTLLTTLLDFSDTGVLDLFVDEAAVALREMTLGSATIRSLTVAFADAPPFRVFGLRDKPAILLGMDALRLFDRVSIDFARRKVRFARLR